MTENAYVAGHARQNRDAYIRITMEYVWTSLYMWNLPSRALRQKQPV